MQINSNQSFTGRFSPRTLAKFKENLDPKDFKKVKNFNAGAKFTKFDIVTIAHKPQRLANGIVIVPKETFAEFSNSRTKSKIKSRIKLANKELPFNMETFKLFTNDLIKKGEELLKIFG